MNWTVEFSNKARKQEENLPIRVLGLLFQQYVEFTYAGTHEKAPYR